jgi:2-polyprenyl-3-methyl-5-hydroxy-6-metoxy-1,4-benzoquinol methylase
VTEVAPASSPSQRRSSPVRLPTYDELVRLRETGRTVGYNGIYIYLRYQAILRLLEGLPLGPTLAVGCGYGIFDRLLPADLDYTGIDLAEAEIAFASAWARAERPSFRYLRGALESFDFRGGTFDLVILSEVLEHVPAPEVHGLLQRAVDLLAPGGKLLVTVPNHWTLRNRARRLLRRPTVLMDRTHLREFDLVGARHLLDDVPVTVRRFDAAVLYFPKERLVAKILAPGGAIRREVARRFPALASHFLLLAEKR